MSLVLFNSWNAQGVLWDKPHQPTRSYVCLCRKQQQTFAMREKVRASKQGMDNIEKKPGKESQSRLSHQEKKVSELYKGDAKGVRGEPLHASPPVFFPMMFLTMAFPSSLQTIRRLRSGSLENTCLGIKTTSKLSISCASTTRVGMQCKTIYAPGMATTVTRGIFIQETELPLLV